MSDVARSSNELAARLRALDFGCCMPPSVIEEAAAFLESLGTAHEPRADQDMPCWVEGSTFKWSTDGGGQREATPGEVMLWAEVERLRAAQPPLAVPEASAALRTLVTAVKALGTLEDGKTLFESSPAKSQTAFDAWLALNQAVAKADYVLTNASAQPPGLKPSYAVLTLPECPYSTCDAPLVCLKKRGCRQPTLTKEPAQ